MSRQNRQRARERMKAMEARRRRRNRLLVAAGSVAAAAIAFGVVFGVASGGTPAAGSAAPPLKLAALSTLGTLRAAPPAGSPGPEGVPIPAAAPLIGTTTITTGSSVDGIGCQTSEQTLFHIHAHLTIFVSGIPRQVPAGVGIPGAQAQATAEGPFIDSGSCFYWLHTHAADGVIHIESPVKRTYTLGDFFDEWGQPLGPSQVGPAKGHVTAIYNGQVFQGNPSDIPLAAHAQIQLEVGTPLVAPISITWPSDL